MNQGTMCVFLKKKKNRGKKLHASVPLMLFKLGNLKTVHH